MKFALQSSLSKPFHSMLNSATLGSTLPYDIGYCHLVLNSNDEACENKNGIYSMVVIGDKI